MLTVSSAASLSAMSLHSVRVLAFQVQTDQSGSNLMVVFMGIAAISLLVLALVVVGVLIVLAVVALKAKAAIAKTTLEVKAKVYPIIDKTNGLVADLTPTIKGITEKTHTLIGDLSPRVSGITEDVHGITSRARGMVEFVEAKLHDFAPAIDAGRETLMEATATARSANNKTAQQVERVNGMVTAVLDWTNQVPVQLQRGISVKGKKFGDAVEQIRKKGESMISATQGLWGKSAQRRPRQEGTPVHPTHIVHPAGSAAGPEVATQDKGYTAG